MGNRVPERAMVILSHPDEVEYFAGGLVAQWAAAGCDITLVLLTSGDKGSDDPAMAAEQLVALREQEQHEAAAVLGVKKVVFFREPDCELVPTLDLRQRVVAELRRCRPDAVITADPTRYYFHEQYDNHPDLRAAGDVALAAIFPAARSRLYHPELLEQGLEPHVVKEVWLVGSPAPDRWIDISDVFMQKVASLCRHRTQVRDPQALEARMRASSEAQDDRGETVYREAYRYMSIEQEAPSLSS